MFSFLLKKRYPVRVMLLTLIVGLLVSTVGTVAAITYFGLRGAINEISHQRFTGISRATSDKVRNLLEPSAKILNECETLASRNLLPVDDQDALGERLVERLRFQPQQLTWLSYGDSQGRFTGAHRRDKRNPDDPKEKEEIILNRSWIGEGGGSMIEQIIDISGLRRLFQKKDKWDYDPRKREFYGLAAATPDKPVWTKPYDFFNEEGKGITCALALRDARGAIRGVFTADFRLDAISKFLADIEIGKTGRAAVVRFNGDVIADPYSHATKEKPDPLLTRAIESLPKHLAMQKTGDAVYTTFDVDGVTHLAAFETFSLLGELDFATVILVPEHELLGSVRRNTMWTIVIGLLSLILAVVLGNILCGKFARPLQQISADLARVGQFDISNEPAPTSRIQEISIVSEATTRMKASLRSFGRYVPTDVVRELMAVGEEAQLGADMRAVTIFFSDIEGFTKITETLHPQQLVEALGAYFDAMSRVIHWQQGTLDKFVGDGILSFFNAPTPLPDHASRACRAALAAQTELNRLRARWDLKGWPVFRTRIGLHTGDVLVGNIGTPSRFAYTVIGDGVNLASGLESLNKVYGTTILASEITRDATGAEFEWRKVDRVAVKGRARVGFVYELLGEAGAVSANLLAARDRYELAMDAYCGRRFAAAVAEFEASMELRPDDRAAQTMLARAMRLMHFPPSDEWDSVYTHAPG